MSTSHPLDPLSPEEIRKTAEIIRKNPKFSSTSIAFNAITRTEPPKDILLPFLNGANFDIPRKSFSVLLDRPTGRVFEVHVNLTDEVIESEVQVPLGNQPCFSKEEGQDALIIIRTNPDVIARCHQLGLTNMDLIFIDPWAFGSTEFEPDFEENGRYLQIYLYARNFPEDNHYAHPLDFVAIVNLTSGTLVRIEDVPAHNQFTPKKNVKTIVPKDSINYDPDHIKIPLRKDVRPLEIISPEGPSFTVDGNLIEWQKFSFRISFNYREGLVLHHICYQDGPDIRPIIYRASVSEMTVPYGDPRPPFHRKNAFDAGDVGLGFCANSLELGCDCLGSIKYFDATLNDPSGNPITIKNAICLHEEDVGILWKHTDTNTGKSCCVRSRKLILQMMVSVDNYDYGMFWKFAQDGHITFEVKATGIVSTNYIGEPGGTYGSGVVLAPGIGAQYHQHIFCVRIDPMIDGSMKNYVKSVDIIPQAPSEENPHGQGFTTKEVILKNLGIAEEYGQLSPLTGRTWDICHPVKVNENSHCPIAWKLVPGGTSLPLMANEGTIPRIRAGFATRSLWVTPHREDQLYAAGLYVNQSRGGDGLPAWIKDKDDTNLENEDLVLWHCFGITHIPRVEDFPVMPCESCGFTLKPFNFFATNPALDVPTFEYQNTS